MSTNHIKLSLLHMQVVTQHILLKPSGTRYITFLSIKLTDLNHISLCLYII